MNVVVAMKQIPDLQQLRIRNRQPVLQDIPLSFGKIDRNALEAAVQIKETHGGEVIVVSAGNEELQETIKEALAAGADRSYIVADNKVGGLESAAAARILAQVIRKIEDVGLIIFGEGSGDNYSGQVGSRVAGILGLPQVGSVVRVSINEGRAQITRSLEDSLEEVEVPMPAVLIVAADLNEPRIPSVTQALKARQKPRELMDLDGLGAEIGSNGIDTFSNLAPEVDRKRIRVKSARELIEILQANGFAER